MKLAKNRNDRVMVGMGAALAGVLVAVVMTSVISDPQFTELCSVSRLFGNSASAAEEPSKPRMFHAQPANGPVPLARYQSCAIQPTCRRRLAAVGRGASRSTSKRLR